MGLHMIAAPWAAMALMSFSNPSFTSLNGPNTRGRSDFASVPSNCSRRLRTRPLAGWLGPLLSPIACSLPSLPAPIVFLTHPIKNHRVFRGLSARRNWNSTRQPKSRLSVSKHAAASKKLAAKPRTFVFAMIASLYVPVVAGATTVAGARFRGAAQTHCRCNGP